ncbi:MAG: hypothetical protein AAF720_07770 [Pseudomonadota bacterium]
MKFAFVCIGLIIHSVSVSEARTDNTAGPEIRVVPQSAGAKSSGLIDPKIIEAAIANSDDFLANRALFFDAAKRAMQDFGCTQEQLDVQSRRVMD